MNAPVTMYCLELFKYQKELKSFEVGFAFFTKMWNTCTYTRLDASEIISLRQEINYEFLCKLDSFTMPT